jgi:hypothetical protein
MVITKTRTISILREVGICVFPMFCVYKKEIILWKDEVVQENIRAGGVEDLSSGIALRSWLTVDRKYYNP